MLWSLPEIFFIAEATRQVHHLFRKEHGILVGLLRQFEQDTVLDQGAFPILKPAHWR